MDYGLCNVDCRRVETVGRCRCHFKLCRDGLSVERSSLDRLKHGNDFLYRENVLLKEQLLLRQENMRMHGVNILSEVIQLLNEQDLHGEY